MIGTLITKSQLPYARVLYDSLQQHHPGERMLALLVDKADGYFDSQAEPFGLLSADELPVPGFPALAFRYRRGELLEVLKPYFLEYLLRDKGCDKVLLLDAEARIYRPLDELFSHLDSHSMVLIPSYLRGFSGEPEIDNIFHPGVIGASRRPEVLEFLRWWQAHPRLDMAPALVDDVHIYRQPGGLVGHWNLDAQTFAADSLSIFHYGGFQIEPAEGILHEESHLTLADDVPALRPLLEDYRRALLEAGYRTCQHWPYCYDTFSNAVPVAPVFRQIWARTKGYTRYWSTPHRVDGPDSFFNWLQSPVKIPSLRVQTGKPGSGEPIMLNNLALEVYRLRRDCQQQFPDPFGLDQRAFAHWFTAWARAEKIAPPFYQQVEKALETECRRPVLKAYRTLYRHFSNWIYTLYSEEKLLYRIYEKLAHALEKVGVSQFFEDVVAELFEEHNLLPLSVERQQRGEIISRQEPGVNVIGFLRDESGLGRVTRDMIRVFARHQVPVAQVNLGGVPGRLSDYPELALPEGNPHAINLIYFGGINQYLYRLLGEDKFLNRYNIAYLWWELNRFPPLLMDNLRIFNEVWVGSGFAKEALEPVLSVPIYRMPIIIPRPAPVSLTRKELGLPPDKHIFLFVFDPYSNIDRKNPLGFIEAYRRAFSPDFKDTQLVLKAKGLGQFPEAARAIRAAVKSVDGMLINRSVSRAEVDALFAACDTYVSLHRAEGYGATLAEAMLHQKPVIATAYSGNVDFMTPENSYPVPYRLVEIEEDSGPYKKGEYWADADIDEAARLMRHVMAHPEESHQKSIRACKDIEKNYSEEAFSRAIIERLNGVYDHLR